MSCVRRVRCRAASSLRAGRRGAAARSRALRALRGAAAAVGAAPRAPRRAAGGGGWCAARGVARFLPSRSLLLLLLVRLLFGGLVRRAAGGLCAASLVRLARDRPALAIGEISLYLTLSRSVHRNRITCDETARTTDVPPTRAPPRRPTTRPCVFMTARASKERAVVAFERRAIMSTRARRRSSRCARVGAKSYV